MFKLGDKVIQLKTCCGAVAGYQYEIGCFSNGELYTMNENGRRLCGCPEKWKKVKETINDFNLRCLNEQ